MTLRTRALVLGALALIGAVWLIVSWTRTATAPAGLSDAQFTAWATSGTLAGLPVSIERSPSSDKDALAEQRSLYAGQEACQRYVDLALRGQALVSDLTPTVPEIEGVIAERWTDSAVAEDGARQWIDCVSQLAASSEPTDLARVVERGTDGQTSWVYLANSDRDTPVHLLALRQRNVLLTLALQSPPDADLRHDLIEAFDRELAAALSS